MKKILILVVLTILIRLDVLAQSRQWSLRKCCDYAVEHNLQIKQQDNQRRQQELQLSTARNSRLPSVDASIGENISFGRGLTAQNTYTNTNTSSTSFSLSTSVPLFTGFQIPNTIRLNELNLAAAVQDLEKAKNDIRMQVAKAYVQILYDMELCDVAQRQIAIDSMQVQRLQMMLDNGKASGAELSQQQATLAQSRLTATQADNQLQLDVLALTQLLELPSPEGFSIVRPDLSSLPPFGDGLGSEAFSPESIYREALLAKPEVSAEQLRLQGKENNIKIAQAGYYPQLSFSAGLGTNYYNSSGVPNDGFATQLKNNFSQYLGLNLSIPIFNRFQTRNNVRSARIEHETQQIQLDNVKKQLYKEIQQVWYSAKAARQKWQSSQQAMLAAQDAFTLMQAKYENGKANITEFNEAKNNYLKSESDLVQARYEYLYQSSLLDFYRGKTLDF